MANLTQLPNSRWGEWVRFLSSAIVLPVVVAALIFAIRVDRFMTRADVQMVQREEMDKKLSELRAYAEASPTVQLQLADLKESQANLAIDIANLRRDLITFMLKGRL